MKKIATLKAQLYGEIHQYRRLPNQVGEKGEGALTCIKCITIITAVPHTTINIRKPQTPIYQK